MAGVSSANYDLGNSHASFVIPKCAESSNIFTAFSTFLRLFTVRGQNLNRLRSSHDHVCSL